MSQRNRDRCHPVAGPRLSDGRSDIPPNASLTLRATVSNMNRGGHTGALGGSSVALTQTTEARSRIGRGMPATNPNTVGLARTSPVSGRLDAILYELDAGIRARTLPQDA